MTAYEILGVRPDASVDEIKEAYKNLSINYFGKDDEYSNAKLQELNDAYDFIMNNRPSRSNGANVYNEIRQNIDSGNLDAAESQLKSIGSSGRNAQWYYLSGRINQNRGHIEKAYADFTNAYNMEPGNDEYRAAYESMRNSRTGGYRTTDTNSNMGCSACDVCQAIMCLECLCNCCGGGRGRSC